MHPKVDSLLGVALLVCLTLAIIGPVRAADASLPVHQLRGTISWTLGWVYDDNPESGVLCIHYQNNLNFFITGLVYMVVHNTLGQTVQITKVPLALGANQSSNAYIALESSIHTQYVITIFATNGDDGEAISGSSTFTYVV